MSSGGDSIGIGDDVRHLRSGHRIVDAQLLLFGLSLEPRIDERGLKRVREKL